LRSIDFTVWATMATLEYASKGLVGVLTPQANTTAEPEFSILWPRGVAMLVARLTSSSQSMMERMNEYSDGLRATLDQFANAPLDAAAFSCTGSSYLIGAAREAEWCAAIEAEHRYPLITAARAVTDWLAALGAKQIGLVSPYPPELTEMSVSYWQSAGYDVTEVAAIYNDEGDFHPIYSLNADSGGGGLDALKGKNVDAIVMLGTGMPTLGSILVRASWDGPPVTSCTLSLAWRTALAVAGQAPSAENALAWSRGETWGERMKFLAPISV
jgi:maleate isomerase